MRLRRYIALILLVVYLFATGGRACASLACHCTAPTEERMEREAGSCCGARGFSAGRTAAEHSGIPAGESAPAVAQTAGSGCHDSCRTWSSPCCDDRHSLQILLYTGGLSDNERPVRCTVLCLPPSLAVECPCPAHVPALRLRAVERPEPFIPEVRLCATGLRAPPVSA